MPPSIPVSTASRFSRRPFRSTSIRYFSHGPSLRAMAQMAQLDVKMPADKSPTVQRKSAMRAGHGLENKDFGLISGTFIPPTGHNRPVWSRELKVWAKMQWLRTWSSVEGWGRLKFMTWFGAAKHLKPKLDSRKRKLKVIARDLHHFMHVAFAEGNKPAIEKYTTEALRLSLNTRLGNRKPTEILHWNSDYKRLQVISDKVAEIPHFIKTGNKTRDVNLVRQVIVRIESRQKLYRGTPGPSSKRYVDTTSPIWEKPRVRDQNEYVVIQQMVLHGKIHPWRLWGMVEESNPDGTNTFTPKKGAQLRRR
ncbi:hypothetical protein P152DRAFT_460965 [Eremomyces bilateralis CBS 781.70]|uniref:Tim44-like domain-containing protein n=1 Tax=Eremomyces bilateralis CBS 781.70 TaxID=1392243 RepID=A0A6G1FVL6_9PEZI|nr:uncharacterized protein P152DRAFT_460965 [Eremomyces bilateralis CBS 781.70]KAF1809867.1 hypothetical protein P152DRAFT_460965 [Eremomyces bilateralis CBS 781.70]